jgi:hypothetical protein
VTLLAETSDLVSNSYDSAAVDGALAWASSVIEGYCNRNFNLVTGEVVILDPYRGSAILPDFPVVAVTSVEAFLPDVSGPNMSWVTLTNFGWTPHTGFLYDTTGLPGTTWSGGPSWPWLPGSLRVTYTHGYATVPQPVKDVCVRLAQQYLENTGMMVQRRVGDMEARYSGSAGVDISPIDRNILDGYSDVGVS